MESRLLSSSLVISSRTFLRLRKSHSAIKREGIRFTGIIALQRLWRRYKASVCVCGHEFQQNGRQLGILWSLVLLVVLPVRFGCPVPRKPATSTNPGWIQFLFPLSTTVPTLFTSSTCTVSMCTVDLVFEVLMFSRTYDGAAIQHSGEDRSTNRNENHVAVAVCILNSMAKNTRMAAATTIQSLRK